MRTNSLLLVVVSAILVSCAPAAATHPPTPSSLPATPSSLPEGTIIIHNAPGQLVGGTLYGHGQTAVILASRGGYSQTEWSQYAQLLADDGFTALTIGSQDSEGITILYVGYAIEFLRKNGFRHILCVGISNGASGCAYNANEPEIIGIVLITYHGNTNLSQPTLPKLFLGAELDQVYLPQTEKAYEEAAEPKRLVIVPGTSETGPALLDTPGQDLRDILVKFLKACAGE